MERNPILQNQTKRELRKQQNVLERGCRVLEHDIKNLEKKKSDARRRGDEKRVTSLEDQLAVCRQLKSLNNDEITNIQRELQRIQTNRFEEERRNARAVTMEMVELNRMDRQKTTHKNEPKKESQHGNFGCCVLQ